MWIIKITVAVFTVGIFCFGAVKGEPVQSFGTKWTPGSFQRWIENENAIITPEVGNLAIQYCLRTTQEHLDGAAYDKVAVKLVREMDLAFNSRTLQRPVKRSLAALTRLLQKISALKVVGSPRPDTYIKQCEDRVGPELQTSKDLGLVFEGRMHPRPATNLPPALAAKLAQLAKRGVRIHPLTEKDLVEQICKLEGYYSTSRDPRLWKLFSITRAMSNVLPYEDHNDEFVAALKNHPSLPELIGVLNRYSAVAGKPNGVSVGMTELEEKLAREATPVRLTGVALGSATTSLMSFYTTAWREKLQDLVLQPGYPQKPFELISADQVLKAVERTATEIGALKEGQRSASQTEQGMRVVWLNILDFHVTHIAPPEKVYGQQTGPYKSTAALAWLAINAETNIRQNEKLGGIRATFVPSDRKTTRYVYADKDAYEGMVRELDAALGAYRHIDPNGELVAETCVAPVRAFAQAAAAASEGKTKSAVQLDAKDTAVFGKVKFENAFEFKPLIADIGTELMDDAEGWLSGQRDFKLHLATGRWRQVPIQIVEGGSAKEYLTGTPSAFVLHLEKTTSTADWQQSMVQTYDK